MAPMTEDPGRKRPLRRACGNSAATLVEGRIDSRERADPSETWCHRYAEPVSHADASFGLVHLSLDRGHFAARDVSGARYAEGWSGIHDDELVPLQLQFIFVKRVSNQQLSDQEGACAKSHRSIPAIVARPSL
jgi:hypothetical protein